MQHTYQSPPGFSVINLLTIVGIFCVLGGIIFINVSPSKQFALANNTQRFADISRVLNAINQFQENNQGALPTSITTTATMIGTERNLIDLSKDLVPKYLTDIPYDPLTGTPENTKYQISKDVKEGHIIISAPDAELEKTIFVSQK